MNVPFVDLRAQYRSIRNEVLANIQQVLEKCNFVLGEEVRQFEEEFAAYCGVRFAIGVANGTDAIHLAVRAAGIGPGDECLIPANTFIATALGVSYAGARPVPVDADARTFLMDLGKLEKALTPKTKAVIPVHLYGRIMDMEPLLELARKHNLVVIEDAAQAHGAAIRDRKAGSFGTLACFSFYPGKNLGAYGDAGLVATNDPDLKARVEALRNYGSPQKYHHPIIGFNSRLDTLQAAVFAIEELEETAKLYLLLRGLNPRYLTPAQVTDLVNAFGLTLPFTTAGVVVAQAFMAARPDRIPPVPHVDGSPPGERLGDLRVGRQVRVPEAPQRLLREHIDLHLE